MSRRCRVSAVGLGYRRLRRNGRRGGQRRRSARWKVDKRFVRRPPWSRACSRREDGRNGRMRGLLRRRRGGTILDRVCFRVGVWRSYPLRVRFCIAARLRVRHSRREMQEDQTSGEQQGCRDSGAPAVQPPSCRAGTSLGGCAARGGAAGGSAEGGWSASTHQGVPAAAAHEGHKPGLFVCSGEPDITIPQREQAGEADTARNPLQGEFAEGNSIGSFAVDCTVLRVGRATDTAGGEILSSSIRYVRNRRQAECPLWLNRSAAGQPSSSSRSCASTE